MPGYSLPDQEVASLWQHIHREVQRENTIASKVIKPYWWYGAASVAAILVFLAFFLRGNKIQIETAYGETKSIVLPDSSTVVLNANSKLSFAQDWDSKPNREVWLDGEAYFNVRHQSNNQPFKVTMDNGVNVEVLGTSFDVYHRTARTKVVLNTGKIRLNIPSKTKAQDQVVMRPGDLVEVRGNRYDKHKVDANLYLAWTKDKLVLDHTSLREIIRLLKDNYGIEVKADRPALLDQTVSGSMPMPDASNSVNQLAKAFRLKVIKENGSYILKE